MADKVSIGELSRRLASLGVTAGQRWRHFKGGLYTVVGLALQEADLEPVVVYRPDGSDVLFTRPYRDWVATVESGGETVSRFQRLAD